MMPAFTALVSAVFWDDASDSILKFHFELIRPESPS
jgi:hypothetical protein